MATSAPLTDATDSISVYRDLGVDTEGRSHHYDAANDCIVVCETDRRGRGIRGDTDIDQRIPADGNGPREYTWFVHHEVNGVDWRADQ